MSVSVKEKCSTKYELVAPDGGWGYMICLAAVINFIAVTGFMPSFGIIYNDFMIDIGLDSTAVSLVSGVNSMSFAVGGFLTSPLLKLMSIRRLALIITIVYNVGTVSMVFVKSVIPFYMCVGVIQGIGLGLIFNLTYALVNEYFVVKRLFVYSIIKTLIGIFVMFAPQMVKFALREYGFKGTLLMITAVSLQSFVAVALMQPVAWHMKKVEIQPLEEETKVLLSDKKSDDNEIKSKLTDEAVESQTTKTETFETEYSIDGKPSRFIQILNDLFDVPTIKALLKSNVSWGIAMSGVAEFTFMIFIPQALYSYGWSKDYVALAVSSVAFGDMAGRGSFIICSRWLVNVENQYLFLAGMLISVITRVGILCTSNVTVALVFLTLYGVGRCFFAIFMPLVISDAVEPGKATAALGFIMIMLGVANLACGPIIGAIRDYTQSYDVTFWVLAATLLASFISWSIEMIYKKRKQVNKKNKS